MSDATPAAAQALSPDARWTAQEAWTPTAPTRRYDCVRDGQQIYRQSFATIAAEVRLGDYPDDLRELVVRVVHAAGDTSVAADVAASPQAVSIGHRALQAGAPILTDSYMLAAGVTRRRLPQDNDVLCTLRHPDVPATAARWRTTRSAAAVSWWLPHLAGAVVAIGNAPTALFHLLELLADGAPRPALIVGMPVGFVGSVESKVALAQDTLPGGDGVPWVTVHGRRGGSAMAAAAVNAIANPDQLA